MKQKIAHKQEPLVRTTMRLPKTTYQHLKMLSIEVEQPMQDILDQAIWQYKRRRDTQFVQEILKQTVTFKPGKFPKQRSDYYDEYFDRKFGARR